MVEVEVDEAEIVYEKASPTFPFAIRELVIVGTSHTGGREFTVTVAVAVAVVWPLVQVMVYVVVVFGETTCEPAVVVADVHTALHEDALLDVHASVEFCP